MPKITINGKEVEVKEGTSIIEAMQQSGDRIAHYCWHPGLSVAGVCRLCMVEIEGNPRVQIACNTMATEGMKINNTSEKVRDAVKWGLDFHLINHPLDCPICDQAGECGLQDQYMEYGKYDPEMAEPKQKKHKVVDLGPTVVLDSERCILCSRCVRFTEEVSKTNELGLFNRGDRTEIGTHDGMPLNNKYSLNTVDICPVGALTSKDFRFRQRVWYLKDSETVCNGCSTGCNVKVYYNREGFFRVKPVYNEKVNGHWMCDEGREIYKFVNKDHRLLKAQVRNNTGWTEMHAGAAAKAASEVVKSTAADSLALVLTAQYTVEEFDAIVGTFVNEFKSKKVYFWINNKESFDEFDGLLLRGDKNPNTKGLLKVLEKHGISATWNELSQGLAAGSIKTVVVAGPENQAVFPDFADRVKELSKAQNLIWLQAGKNEALSALTGNVSLIPMKTFVEKDGTFINHAGLEQKFKKATVVVSEALTLTEAALLLAGKNLAINASPANEFMPMNQRIDQVEVEARKKNEFVFKRGSL
ncbi:2Fe-2S iron-sulfur cluster-binding protein [Bdellovibrio svalbardensis]|uniref:2Fe-2S iron-sulfur cluster-binding protein n=1 Tax=Bdellovibrio svalbardensis TaxID=2972972 RepID=A0ABT6DFP5_9BACT|nr:2Fe-2S iron-sulfur cluster-binding protein [Bdellovibrio svalbardensis]MDG0815652.1 2Fe-2S iron-sulfur cluster-binding protein [Bdellovibrio svalbardensis]